MESFSLRISCTTSTVAVALAMLFLGNGYLSYFVFLTRSWTKAPVGGARHLFIYPVAECPVVKDESRILHIIYFQRLSCVSRSS